MRIPALRAFLDADFETRPLKSPGLRARNALKPWLIRQPPRGMSWQLTTRDGRRYKLLRYPRSVRDRREQVERRLRALSAHPAVPALLWSDDRHLLVEWSEGVTPRPEDPHFGRRLGEAFAELYRVDFQERPLDEVLEPFLAWTQELEESGHLGAGSAARMAARLASELPERVPTSMLCGDQTMANFLLDADGSLYMIDPGSFQSGLPVDLVLLGGGLYHAIDRQAFHEGYAHAEGIDFPFLHAAPLALMHDLRTCALQQRVLARTSRLEPRRRNGLAARIGETARAIRERLD